MRATAALLGLVVVVAAEAIAAAPHDACERAAARALRRCVRGVNEATRRCYVREGRACPAGAAAVAGALARLERRVVPRCPDAGTVQSAGYGPLFTPSTLVTRLRAACTDAAASLAARSFGGPHAAILAGADASGRSCLASAHREASRLLQRSLIQHSRCLLRTRRGGACDPDVATARIATASAIAAGAVAAACPTLENLVTVDAATFVSRAAAQVRCLAAAAHPETAPFDLDCGPRPDVPVPARATAVQIVLDETVWGTRCGDGSPYAFWIRLAPPGAPVERVVVHMQGGGVCIFESDCSGVSAGLLRSLDNTLDTGGYMSNDPALSPFGDWTKVYLPYCTQDVHFGGGGTSVFPSVTVHRFGAVNVRAALRYVRDVLWAELDRTTPEGYRPDRLRVVFGGTSAGGFGASYNYHYVLDDLRWIHTAAAPSAAAGLDNGQLVGIRSLGPIFVADSGPFGWAALPYMAPYCTPRNLCAVVPLVQASTALRLGAVPEQQMLNISNQVDTTQRNTTFFPDTPSWVNALREAYCDTQGLTGLRYFLPAIPSSIHSIIANSPQFQGMTSDGVVLKDWLAQAMAAPATLADRVEEGTLVGAIAGVEPFGCVVD